MTLTGAYFILSCSSAASKQPELLSSEVIFFYSLRREGAWYHVERSIHNVDSSGERAFKGADWTESWGLSYRYSLFMETRDSIFFSHVDTNYVSRLFETMCHYIRPKELQHVSIYLTYVYEEDHRSVAHDKRYHLRREGSDFVFYNRYPN